MFSIIAAIGKNNEIGKNNQLIFHLKEDMQFFRKTTTGHPIIMGRKTWESLPGKLKKRENIVISHHEVTGADIVVSDLPDYILKHKDSDEEIFVIGGATIYQTFLPYAKYLYLTEINAHIKDADAFFPKFNKTEYSKEILKKGSENGLDFSITKYTKK